MIGILDKAAAMGKSRTHEKVEIALVAEIARDQTIGLLASFSDANQRLKTYDFGFEGKRVEELVRQREKSTGVDGSGCVLEGGRITGVITSDPIEAIESGSAILCFDADEGIVPGTVLRTKRKQAKKCLVINDALKVTPDHPVYVRELGYVEARLLHVGLELLSDKGRWDPVQSVREIQGEFTVYGIETTGGNLFAGGYLVHNKQG